MSGKTEEVRDRLHLTDYRGHDALKSTWRRHRLLFLNEENM